MASDGSPAAISSAGAVLSSQVSDPTKFQPAGGKTLPPSGNATAAAAASTSSNAAGVLQQSSKSVVASTSATSTGTVSNSTSKPSQAKTTAASTSDPQSLVDQINKSLNDSGRADQFRLSPDSSQYIQQVNPSNGAVIAEYAVSEFPALARSIGVSGLLIDDVA